MAKSQHELNEELLFDIERRKPKKQLKPDETMRLERELRRYVKRAGGFRKGLPEADKKTATRLMKVLGRDEPEWNTGILIPGYDIPEPVGEA